MDIKIRINGNDVEGAADDIALLIRSLGGNELHREPDRSDSVDSTESQMPKEFADLALSRRTLSPSQRKLFRMLLRTETGWLPTSEIMRKMNFNGNQHGGLFGAIGRRVAMTKGFKEGFTLFEWQWNDEREEHDCRLHPAALDAVRRIDP